MSSCCPLLCVQQHPLLPGHEVSNSITKKKKKKIKQTSAVRLCYSLKGHKSLRQPNSTM